MGIFHMPTFANGHIFFEMGIFTEYAQKKPLPGMRWYAVVCVSIGLFAYQNLFGIG